MVKILHIYPISKVLEIWESAAVEYKKANPAVKVQFDYLESEEFKAKLPTNDRPSVFHSWGADAFGISMKLADMAVSPNRAWITGSRNSRVIEPVMSRSSRN
jgi:hypothetical protein